MTKLNGLLEWLGNWVVPAIFVVSMFFFLVALPAVIIIALVKRTLE